MATDLLTNYDPSSSSSSTSKALACVIGLGGGGLLNFLQYAFQHVVKLTVVELDPSVVEIAEKYFGFTPNDDSIRVVVGDGLQVGPNAEKQDDNHTWIPDTSFEPESLSFLVIDVDSKDKTVGYDICVRFRSPSPPLC